MPAAAVLGGASIASTVFGGIMGIQGAKKQKQAARAAAYYKSLENLENQRRQGLQDKMILGRARAAAAASGALLNDQGQTSTSRYVNELSVEMSKEMAWMIKAGKAEVSAISKGASIQYGANMANVFSDVTTGIISGLSQWYRP